MFKNITVLVCIAVTFFLVSCISDAPHDNPVDPYLSKSNQGLQFRGTVYTIYQPFQPLENVKVSIEQIGKYVYTDHLGQFEIGNLEEKTYIMILYKDKYQPDTLNLNITRDSLKQDFFLNALPQMVNIQYFSEKISTIFSAEPIVKVHLEIEANDPDGFGDVDSVQAWIPGFSFKSTLEPGQSLGTYHQTIDQTSLLEHNIHDLVEKPLSIILTDKYGSKNIAGPYYISRFIQDIPQTISPANQEVAIQPLFFLWDEIELPFQFTFEINIYKRESGLSVLIHNQAGIDTKATNYNYNTFLNNGIYYWTITINDALRNSSESEEAVFQIR